MKTQWMPSLAASSLCVALIAAAAAQSDAASAPPHGPPPEAIAACQGKTAGTSVSFSAHGMTMTGVCQMAGNVLAARPVGGQGGPPTGNRPPPPQR